MHSHAERLGLSPAEAITASTINAAYVLGLQDNIGSIEEGKRADIQLLDCYDERELSWHISAGSPLLVAIKGEVVHLLTDGEMDTEGSE